LATGAIVRIKKGLYCFGDPFRKEAIRNMLDRCECRSRDDYANALREILLKPSNGLFQFNMRLIVDDKRKNAPLQI